MIQYREIFITPRVIKRIINIFELYGSEGHLKLLEDVGLYMLWSSIVNGEHNRRDNGVRLSSPLQDVADDIFLKYLRRSLITGKIT